MPASSKRKQPVQIAEDGPAMTDNGATTTNPSADRSGASPNQSEGSPTGKPQRSPRKSRAQQQRAVNPARPQAQPLGRRPDLLEAPAARPGMSQRWLAHGDITRANQRIAQKMDREGWRPRLASTAPEYRGPTMAHGTIQGVIVCGDLILCEIPTDLLEATRGAAIAHQRERHRVAVEENPFNVEDHRLGPIHKQKRQETKFGRARPSEDDDGMFDDD